VSEPIKAAADAGAAVTAVLAIFQLLPYIAAGLSIIWYSIRIYEYFKTKKVVKD